MGFERAEEIRKGQDTERFANERQRTWSNRGYCVSWKLPSWIPHTCSEQVGDYTSATPRWANACSSRGNSIISLHVKFPGTSNAMETVHQSHPLLHRAFTVQYVARRAFPFELKDSVNQDKKTQGQYAGDDDGYGFHSIRRVVQFDHDVNVILRVVTFFLFIRWSITSHKVFKDGPWVPWFHSELLIVKLPVLLLFVEVCEAYTIWETKQLDSCCCKGLGIETLEGRCC